MNELTTNDKTPDAPRPPVNSVTLYVMLSRNYGSSLEYDAQKRELSARCAAEGYVWNTDSKFQWKRCSVTFCLDTTDRLAEFARGHRLQAACGSIEVAAGLEPETFDSDGQQIALPPINIVIFLDDAPYNKADELLRSCITNDREVSLSLEFSHRDFTRTLMALDNLDLAAKSTYPIVRFNIGRTRQANTKVYVPKYKYDAATSVGLTFTAADTAIQTSVWHSEFSISEIRLTGKMRSQKLGVNSDDDTIEIKEYEETGNWKPGYPEEAFPGTVSVSKDEAHTYCSVTLYATREILMRLATLLSGMSKGDTVRFDILMIAEGLPLKVGERKHFDVTGYTPVLVKSYS